MIPALAMNDKGVVLTAVGNHEYHDFSGTNALTINTNDLLGDLYSIKQRHAAWGYESCW